MFKWKECRKITCKEYKPLDKNNHRFCLCCSTLVRKINYEHPCLTLVLEVIKATTWTRSRWLEYAPQPWASQNSHHSLTKELTLLKCILILERNLLMQWTMLNLHRSRSLLGWTPLQKFFLRGKIIFWVSKICDKAPEKFSKSKKILILLRKLYWSKNLTKNSAKKLILCELLSLHLKYINNVKRKRLWVRPIFLESHLKGEFYILVNELNYLSTSSFSAIFHDS